MAMATQTDKSEIFLAKVEKALSRALDQQADSADKQEKLRNALVEVSRTREALSEKIAE